ncbi:unnamed protein product [Symbiodinium pilosum]|uniref:Pentatricopeptide repeat-containing protein, chloroplastic n=1 Tax=Symbiodinium pilosum TaxID=2952 RepID=A0A812WU21_SYMPI|nr:unnamed protein product [Symbiodinium pilosum]
MTLGAAIGACDNGLWQRALVLLGTAAELQVQPDGVMHSSCISMCEKGSQWQHGLLLLCQERAHGANISCYNAAMSACSRCSRWQVALALFLELPSVSLRPDVISHNAMISSCFESWLLAMYFLDSLVHSRLQPTPVTLNAALSALGSEHWTAALGLLQLRDKNLLPDLITYHTLITCSKAEWQRACAWLTELNVQYLQKDLITRSAVITACTNSNEWKLALQFGGEASFGDAHTFADTIGACDCGRRWQAALSSLQLLHVLALKSDLITINAARSACASQGSWQRVLRSLQEVSMEHSTMEEHASALTAYDTAVIACPARPDDAGSDEEDPELYEQLSKQRRLVKRADTGQAKKGEAALTQVSERIQGMGGEEDEEVKEHKEKELLGLKKDTDSNVALTATTEFCNVVQTPLEKIETLKHESFRGSTLYKQQATQRKGVAAGERKARKAGLPEEVMAATKDAEEDLEQTLIEESLDLSCASGLEYLRARSQIGCDQDSHRIRKLDNRPLEMSTVDGDIKLEYRDDFGRVQTPKEAFRSISWKFHGKVPGRKNMERRLLRLENEMRLKSMNVIEALPTLRALRHAQTAEAKPYMVLSGANEK